MHDAVIIGAGHNGLVAANLLAQEGWSVLVLEGGDAPGGAVKSAELVEAGFTNDVFSAFYPFTVASPVMQGLDLKRYGLRWRSSRIPLAHPSSDGTGAALSTDLDETAAWLDAEASGDGDGWRRLYALWEQIGDALLEGLLTPFPPVRAGAKLAARLRGELVRFVRFGLLPVRRLADETFSGEGGGLLLAGNTLHSDLTPESAGGGLYGWLLASLGQQYGYPVPEGGAGAITDALVRRLEAHGGRVECGARVSEVIVRAGRAVGVRTADGREIEARRATFANTSAPALYLDLVGAEHLPARLLDDLKHFEWDTSTFKVDWTLDGVIPWAYETARAAGTVHIVDGLDGMTEHATRLQTGRVPEHPFLVSGQYSPFDETRAPAGKETYWAYTHVPRKVKGDVGGEGLTGAWDERESELFADRMEREIEERAPGFRALVRGRHIASPATLERMNPNLAGGAINNGTAQLHQQLVFRPTPGAGRPETPIRDLYLASGAAHPGGGVHGGPGSNAARAAMRARPVARTMIDLRRRIGRS